MYTRYIEISSFDPLSLPTRRFPYLHPKTLVAEGIFMQTVLRLTRQWLRTHLCQDPTGGTSRSSGPRCYVLAMAAQLSQRNHVAVPHEPPPCRLLEADGR